MRTIYSILGSILGSPYLGKLLFCYTPILSSLTAGQHVMAMWEFLIKGGPQGLGFRV